MCPHTALSRWTLSSSCALTSPVMLVDMGDLFSARLLIHLVLQQL